MIIVVTGLVGIDKKPYLAEVCRTADQRGRRILLCNVGQMMYAESPDIAPGRILDISLKRLHRFVGACLRTLCQTEQHEHVIVYTHATFSWRHGCFRRLTSIRCGSSSRTCLFAWLMGSSRCTCD
jgi:hypothetical protein